MYFVVEPERRRPTSLRECLLDPFMGLANHLVARDLDYNDHTGFVEMDEANPPLQTQGPAPGLRSGGFLSHLCRPMLHLLDVLAKCMGVLWWEEGRLPGCRWTPGFRCAAGREFAGHAAIHGRPRQAICGIGTQLSDQRADLPDRHGRNRAARGL